MFVLQVWGWEDDGSLCAYKSDQQQPIPLQMGFKKLSWSDTPACEIEPVPTVNNSVPDNAGCLWGWQLDRNCPFKDTAAGQPLYYAGYDMVCNTTASAIQAVEHNDQHNGTEW